MYCGAAFATWVLLWELNEVHWPVGLPSLKVKQKPPHEYDESGTGEKSRYTGEECAPIVGSDSRHCSA
jgi:hypothetical protein